MMIMAELQSRQADIETKKKKIELDAQKLELERQKAELDQVELLLRAKKDEQTAALNIYDHELNLQKTRITHGLDHKKIDRDYDHKIAALLTDVYKHANPPPKEKKAD
jgi:hypothetical protein